MKKIKFILNLFLLLLIYIYVSYISLLPDNIFLINGQKYDIKRLLGIELVEIQETSQENLESTNVEVKLLGKINIKNIKITSIDDAKVVPVGKVIGLKLYSNGVLVVGLTEIEDKNNVLKKSYENSDLKAGDTILEIDEKQVENINSLKNIVDESNGKKMDMTILRNGTIINTSIMPIEIEEKKYQLGLWVKDAATGVGTMTFYEPQSGGFGILGHGITDSDTNNLINIERGELVTAKIFSIQKGIKDNPGEIKGTIVNQPTIGIINKNTSFGVYGVLNNLTSLNIDITKAIEVAQRNEIEEGEAEIFCSINSSNVAKKYKIEIEKIYYDNNYNNKSMLIKIIDEELLEETGGIIRGLSGAPIIQNGKFVGAVTNVLVSDPQIGYAVFADIMLKELNEID